MIATAGSEVVLDNSCGGSGFHSGSPGSRPVLSIIVVSVEVVMERDFHLLESVRVARNEDESNGPEKDPREDNPICESEIHGEESPSSHAPQHEVHSVPGNLASRIRRKLLFSVRKTVESFQCLFLFAPTIFTPSLECRLSVRQRREIMSVECGKFGIYKLTIFCTFLDN